MEIEITKRSKTRQRNKKVFKTTVQPVIKNIQKKKLKKKKKKNKKQRNKWEK